ncbi:MAG: hypothetical protein DHS20C11_30350 [Lysobacteraceae bacterium]|nr:MAG: hypothetical protein DHS20C11_30350 [Xanthomonadaceae bacterium]
MPFLAVVLAAIHLLIWFLGSEQATELWQRYGVIFVTDAPWSPQIAARLGTGILFHTDVWHLATNLIFLLVFGMPLERQWGALRTALFLMLAGTVGNLVMMLNMTPNAAPVIGASGAISGVIGAYLVNFPTSRIGLLIPLGLFVQYVRVPALVVIGAWIGLQIAYTLFEVALGPVAWWAHVAGFVSGVVFAAVVKMFR